jgi:hypothetical protein
VQEDEKHVLHAMCQYMTGALGNRPAAPPTSGPAAHALEGLEAGELDVGGPDIARPRSPKWDERNFHWHNPATLAEDRKQRARQQQQLEQRHPGGVLAAQQPGTSGLGAEARQLAAAVPVFVQEQEQQQRQIHQDGSVPDHMVVDAPPPASGHLPATLPTTQEVGPATGQHRQGSTGVASTTPFTPAHLVTAAGVHTQEGEPGAQPQLQQQQKAGQAAGGAAPERNAADLGAPTITNTEQVALYAGAVSSDGSGDRRPTTDAAPNIDANICPPQSAGATTAAGSGGAPGSRLGGVDPRTQAAATGQLFSLITPPHAHGGAQSGGPKPTPSSQRWARLQSHMFWTHPARNSTGVKFGVAESPSECMPLAPGLCRGFKRATPGRGEQVGGSAGLFAPSSWQHSLAPLLADVRTLWRVCQGCITPALSILWHLPFR